MSESLDFGRGSELERLSEEATLERALDDSGLAPVTRIDEAIVQQTIQPEDYQELDVAFNMDERILWYAMNPKARPSFTVGLIQEILKLQENVRAGFARSPEKMGPPVRYMVLGSALPRIFNLGGDLGLFAQLIRHVRVRTERLPRLLESDALCATDLAEYLVERSVPFREAHEAVGKLVAEAERQGRPLRELGLTEWKRFAPQLDARARALIDPWRSVERKRSVGGTSPQQVSRAITRWRRRLRRL